MPRPFLMGVVRVRCQQRANMVGDPSIETPEWHSMISEVYGEAYEEVADVSRYFERQTTFTTVGAGYLAEPTDHLSMVDNLELVLDTSTGRVRRLYPVQPQERAMLSGRTGDPRRFEMVDNRFYLYPTPPAGKQITLRYIPQSPDLSTYGDSDLVDVVCSAGESFLIWGVAAIAKSKDERFVDFAETQKEKARPRLQQWARNRSQNNLPRQLVEDDYSGDVGDWEDRY